MTCHGPDKEGNPLFCKVYRIETGLLMGTPQGRQDAYPTKAGKMPALQGFFQNVDQPVDLLDRVVVDEADADDAVGRVEAERLAQPVGVHVAAADRDPGAVDHLA